MVAYIENFTYFTYAKSRPYCIFFFFAILPPAFDDSCKLTLAIGVFCVATLHIISL
jgi:hypothetical protein